MLRWPLSSAPGVPDAEHIRSRCRRHQRRDRPGRIPASAVHPGDGPAASWRGMWLHVLADLDDLLALGIDLKEVVETVLEIVDDDHRLEFFVAEPFESAEDAFGNRGLPFRGRRIRAPGRRRRRRDRAGSRGPGRGLRLRRCRQGRGAEGDSCRISLQGVGLKATPTRNPGRRRRRRICHRAMRHGHPAEDHRRHDGDFPAGQGHSCYPPVRHGKPDGRTGAPAPPSTIWTTDVAVAMLADARCAARPACHRTATPSSRKGWVRWNTGKRMW